METQAYILAPFPIDGDMLRNLLKSRAPAFQPTVPEGRRIYAIGDVHGCLDLLDQLIEAIDADDAARDQAATTLMFLGDLVDRGPDSAGVVERVRQLAGQRPDVRLLLGNHEEVFIAALDGDPRALRLFCRIGGRETAISYGIAASDYESMSYEELAVALVGCVPEEHRAFLGGCSEMEIVGDYAFVHAGVHPTRSFEDQRGSDLRWIRDPFLDYGSRLAKIVVHGHTIAETVEFKDHRIGIDTGAYMTGKLSALALEPGSTWVIDTAM